MERTVDGGLSRLERVPQVTHEGELQISGLTIRVYHLDNGQRIIPTEDFEAFLEWLEAGPREAEKWQSAAQPYYRNGTGGEIRRYGH
jgi:hypothetical protein